MYKLNFDRWVDILLSIPEKGCSQADLAKKTDTEYAHISNVMKELIKNELVFMEKDNNSLRRNLVTITKKGKEVREKLLEAKNVLNNGKKND